MAYKTVIRDYYYLTKPGIIYGNLFTAAAGFLFACRWHIDFFLFISTLGGIALVIGSACVFNNYIDRDIDHKMKRTKKRALVKGRISNLNALAYACLLGLAGFVILYTKTNDITVILGLIGFVDYVIIYGITKRKFTQGTLVGSISGAVPIAAGYTAVSGRFDTKTLSLFLILTLWQMPHFYSIAIYRYNEYKSAGLPVLPVAKNIAVSKQRILFYIIGLILSLVALKLSGGGYTYLFISMLFCAEWLRRGLKTYNSGDDQKWGKQMFLFSLIVICGLSVAISLGALLP